MFGVPPFFDGLEARFWDYLSNHAPTGEIYDLTAGGGLTAGDAFDNTGDTNYHYRGTFGKALDMDGIEYAGVDGDIFLEGQTKFDVFFTIDPRAIDGDFFSIHGGTGFDRGIYFELHSNGTKIRLTIYGEEFDVLLVANTDTAMTTTGEVHYQYLFSYDGGRATAADRVLVWQDGVADSFTFTTGTEFPDKINNVDDPTLRVGASADGTAGGQQVLGEIAIIMGDNLSAAERTDWFANGVEWDNPKCTAAYRWLGRPTLPFRPTGLTVDLHLNGYGAVFNWTRASLDNTGWRIEYKTGASNPPGGSWLVLDDTLAAATVTRLWLEADAGPAIIEDNWYTFRIFATNAEGDSLPSNEVTIKLEELVVPLAPSGVIATENSETSILLQWNDNSHNETGFTIERREASYGPGPFGAWTHLKTTGPNETSYLDGV